jgi:hypothetical protein
MLNLNSIEEFMFAQCLSRKREEYSLFKNNCTDPVEQCLAELLSQLEAASFQAIWGVRFIMFPAWSETDFLFRSPSPSLGREPRGRSDDCNDTRHHWVDRGVRAGRHGGIGRSGNFAIRSYLFRDGLE